VIGFGANTWSPTNINGKSLIDFYPLNLLSFANQALSAEYMAKDADKLEKKVYSVPTKIDNKIAHLKLEAMGVKIDTFAPEQVKCSGSWEGGT